MLVKNTIIALMAVAPALTIPVPGPGAATTATTIKSVAKAVTAKVSKAAISKAEGNVRSDMSNDNILRKELKAADAKLATDRSAAKKLEKQGRAQKNAKAKLTKTSHLSTGLKHLSKDLSALAGSRNKHNLRITTGSRGARHSVISPHRSALSPLRSGGSARSSLRTAVGTGQSPYFGGYSPGFQSPGFSPPFSGNMKETLSFQPSSGGGYTENISFSPQAQQISRRALTPTTPSTILTSPSALVPAHRSRKSATLHQHTLAEAMQLSALLVEAEKVVNGLEAQMNQPQTVFANLKRKSKFKRPTTPATPATPATPVTPVKST